MSLSNLISIDQKYKQKQVLKDVINKRTFNVENEKEMLFCRE